jgi:hypothetical protein
MAKPIIVHPAQESTSKEKTSSCSGCGQHFPCRELREVHEEQVAFGYGVWVGERYCWSCAQATGLV